MEVCVLFTSHRVEMLEHFKDYAMRFDEIVIEEPRDDMFKDMLEGKITVDSYVEKLNTSFPVYSKYQCEMLRYLHGLGKRIYQIEPYLEILERIHRSIERKEELPEDERSLKVREIERKVNEAWIDYQEAFLRKDFDALVEATVRYSKADAERFRIRDRMRAEEISRVIGDRALVEAGQIHVLLPKYLEELGFRVSTVNLPEMISKKLGIELYLNPGNELTIKYMLGEEVSHEEARLLSARGIIYISLIPKKELLPSEKDPYPHLVRENKVAKTVRKLDYEDCKRLFYRIWSKY